MLVSNCVSFVLVLTAHLRPLGIGYFIFQSTFHFNPPYLIFSHIKISLRELNIHRAGSQLIIDNKQFSLLPLLFYEVTSETFTIYNGEQELKKMSRIVNWPLDLLVLFCNYRLGSRRRHLRTQFHKCILVICTIWKDTLLYETIETCYGQEKWYQ